MQSTGHTFTHIVQEVHTLMSLWRKPRKRSATSHRSSGYWRVISSLTSTPYRAVIRIPFAVVTTASTMSFMYSLKPILPALKDRCDQLGDPLAAEQQQPHGNAQKVDERKRNQVFPGHAHELIDPQARKRPAD